MATTFEKLSELIVDRLGVSADEINEDSRFRDDLGADSLDVVELIMEVEDEFDVEIPDEQAEKLHTVLDVVKYIENNK